MRVLLVVLLAGCSPVATPPDGSVGEEGEVVFQAENATILAADTRLVVGSAFDVVGVAKGDASLDGAVFVSGDEDVLRVVAADVAAGRVEVTGAGEAFLVVRSGDGDEIDRIAVRAAVPKTRGLLEAQLVNSSVDARLPDAFAVVADQDLDVFVGAVDRCGGGLLDWRASPPVSSDEAVLTVAPHDVAGYTLTPVAGGEAMLTVATPGVDEPLSFAVRVIDPALVDDVVPTASAKLSDDSVELWGRAYAGDDEVVGLTYGWSATQRVTLSNARGPTTIATVAGVAGTDGGVVEGDAIVTASARDEEGTVDLFSTSIPFAAARRDDPASDPDEPPATGGGCGGGQAAVCDPAAAAVLLVGARRLRRRRACVDGARRARTGR